MNSEILEGYFRNQAARSERYTRAQGGAREAYWAGRGEAFTIAADVLSHFVKTGELPTPLES